MKTRYHDKTDAELAYIIKDATEAREAMRGFDTVAENKYADQVCDACSEVYIRKNRKGGKK